MDIAAAVGAGDALWAAGVQARAEWLAEGFGKLANAGSALGRRARTELPAGTGLSPEMVAWGLSQALTELTNAERLAGLVESIPALGLPVRPGQLCALVLAGNVFTAAARAALWPLLLGWPVVAKAPRDDAGFPLLLAEALSSRFPGAFQALSLAPGEQLDTLLSAADAVSVFGSDETVREVRSKLAANASFQAHGHGLGAAYIARSADGVHLRELARAFALDVAAYDQRGCMSPHALFIEGDAEPFAALLHEELDAIERVLPRAALPFEVATEQRAYRDRAALQGLLFEGATHAVAIEARFRASPGMRNVQVLPVASRSEFIAQIAPFGAHLKCLAVAGATPHELVPHFPARLAPRICALGTMQVPAASALTDGYPPWEGLVTFAECT